MLTTLLSRVVCLVLFSMLLTACAHGLRSSPDSTLDAKWEDSEENQAARDLDAATDRLSRNKALDRRLELVDREYRQYVGDLNYERNRNDVFSSVGQLILGLAGTVADSSGAKTNYAALSALLQGSNATINEKIYFQQTIVALVDAMDAARMQVRVQIKHAMRESLEDYTGGDAYLDVVRYELAGTLVGAVGYISATSQLVEQSASEEFRDIESLSADQRITKRCATLSLAPTNTKRTLAAMTAAATTLKVAIPAKDASDPVAVATLLQSRIRHALAPELAGIGQAFSAAGFLIDCK